MPIKPVGDDVVRFALVKAGAAVPTGQFTFSVPGVGSIWPDYAVGSEPFTGYRAFNSFEADVFRKAMRAWDDFIAPDFVELADGLSTRGAIRAAYSTKVEGTTLGYAYQFPGSLAGDIWINPTGTRDPDVFYQTLLHEIGHTLGLKHPFEGGGNVFAQYDKTDFTVMSYTSPSRFAYIQYINNQFSYYTVPTSVITPMVADIIAAQSIYGADLGTRTGDDIYKFNLSNLQFKYQTIYDSAGIDTIDASENFRPNNIDLQPGAYSDVGRLTLREQALEIQKLVGIQGDTPAAFQQRQAFEQYAQYLTQVLLGQGITPFEFIGNVAIAFGTVIENAIGGKVNDVLSGNDANNILSGLDGNDELFGRNGNDTLIGGTGADILTGGTGADIFTVNIADYSGGWDTITDFVVGVDKLSVGGGRFFVGSANFSGRANEVRAYVGFGGLTYVWIDLNGDTSPDFIFTLNGEIAISASDFIGSDLPGGGLLTGPRYGTSGDDFMVADGPGETLVGGNGWDTYIVNAGTVVVEDAGGGNDIVAALANYTLLPNAEIELLQPATAIGPATAIDLTGSDLPNQVFGNNGANRLDGRAGNDLLRGLGGVDVLIGGTGNDTIDGGADVDTAIHAATRAQATVTRNPNGTLTIASAADGTDTVSNVQLFQFADGLFSFTFANADAPRVANFTVGAGGWTTQDRFPRQVADVNGDGRADIVGFGQGGTLVSLGLANGTFAALTLAIANFGQDQGWSSDNVFRRELADVNGDDLADIVGFGTAGVLVSLAQGGGTFAAPRLGSTNFNPANGWASQDGFARTLADVNGDGFADIVGFGTPGTFVALGTGTGSFGTANFALANFGTNQGWTSDNRFHREVGDVNGDGRADLVGFGTFGTLVALGQANGTFTAPVFALNNFGANQGWSSQDVFARDLADVNGDGRDDIVGFGVAGTLVAYGLANGLFSAAAFDVANFGRDQGWSSDNIFHRELADVNGDGRADIVGFGQSGVFAAIAFDGQVI